MVANYFDIDDKVKMLSGNLLKIREMLADAYELFLFLRQKRRSFWFTFDFPEGCVIWKPTSCTCLELAKIIDIFQVFPSTRSAFRTYYGCLYPISLFSACPLPPQDIPPPLRSTRIAGRHEGGEFYKRDGRLWEYKFRIPVNSSFTIRTSERSAPSSMNINPGPFNRPTWPITSPPCVQLSWTRDSETVLVQLCIESHRSGLLEKKQYPDLVDLYVFQNLMSFRDRRINDIV